MAPAGGFGGGVAGESKNRASAQEHHRGSAGGMFVSGDGMAYGGGGAGRDSDSESVDTLHA